MLQRFVEHEEANSHRVYIECTVCGERERKPKAQRIKGCLDSEAEFIPAGTTHEWNGRKANFKNKHRDCNPRKRRK